ncbi:MAG: NADH-quinone oxidoreductase subunit I [Bacillota bacterium]
MELLLDTWKAARSMFKGLGVTIREFFSPPVTVQYPDQRPRISPLFRGHPVLLSDETGKLKCTACMACARACPVDAISIESARGEDRKMYPKAWNLNMGRCLQCNLCVEACPFAALGMSTRFETAVDDPDGLIYDLGTLTELGCTQPYSRIMVGQKLSPAEARAAAQGGAADAAQGDAGKGAEVS